MITRTAANTTCRCVGGAAAAQSTLTVAATSALMAIRHAADTTSNALSGRNRKVATSSTGVRTARRATSAGHTAPIIASNAPIIAAP